MGGSEIDSFLKPDRRIPHKIVVGGRKTRDDEVPGIFLTKGRH